VGRVANKILGRSHLVKLIHDAPRQRNCKALRSSTRGSNLPTTSSSRRPTPRSRCSRRIRRSLPSRSRNRGTLQPGRRGRQRRNLCRPERRRNLGSLDSLRSRVRSRNRPA